MMKKLVITALCAATLAACSDMESRPGASASATLRPASGSQVQGRISFTQAGASVRVAGEVTGLTPGLHGFHLHEKGDCSAADATSAGAHFNPGAHKHGGPQSAQRHAGDFGNITADANGKAVVNLTIGGISVAAGQPDSIAGRGLVVHALPDDEKTDPTGNSGGRIACGVIQG
jgi:Cu-Zn family superoxide dismutase